MEIIDKETRIKYIVVANVYSEHPWMRDNTIWMVTTREKYENLFRRTDIPSVRITMGIKLKYKHLQKKVGVV
jgi:hypothetical protein